MIKSLENGMVSQKWKTIVWSRESNLDNVTYFGKAKYHSAVLYQLFIIFFLIRKERQNILMEQVNDTLYYLDWV